MSVLTKKNIADMYPLSPMQQGMLFHTQFDPKTSLYFEQFTCTIEGPLDLKHFETAWNHLIDHYDVFRTVFNWKDSLKPFQLVLKKRPVSLGIHDFKNMDRDTQKRKITDFLAADKRQIFDLAKGPLIRLNILELAPEKYFFLWSYHHILLDGWCLSIILADFFSVYMAVKNGLPLPKISRPPYKTYISWLKKQDKEKAASFWKSYLKDFHTPTSLPVDYITGGDVYDNQQSEITLSKETTEKLEAFARQQRTTLSTVIQAVWALQLRFYSGQDDIVFGKTVSGRPPELKGAESIVGLFINTLPVRAIIDPETSFLDFLQDFNTRSTDIMAYEYSFLPEIKACSTIAPDVNLFDSIIVFENYPLDTDKFSAITDIRVTDYDAKESTNYDVTIVAGPGEQLVLRFLYNAARLEAQTIRRMMGHFVHLVEQVLEKGLLPIKMLEIMDTREKNHVMTAFNNTDADFPKDKCPYQLFEDQAAKTPDHIALSFNGSTMTYKELNTRANQLARYLRKRGVKKESKVGLMVARSFDMIVGILGIQKAGGAYVPMDPEYPGQRLEYMLSDSESPVLVTQSSLLERLTQYPENTVTIDGDWAEIAKEDGDNPEPVAGVENLSHLIYTSGSTGLPKGVMIEHRNVTVFLSWALNEFTYDEYKEMIASTSMCFDLSIFEFFLPLITGAKVIILRSSLDLNDYLKTGSATMINTVPSALKHLVGITDKRHRVKTICLAGEPLKRDIVQAAYEKLDVGLIRNLYGPTEDTTYSTGFRISRSFKRQPLIGKPIDNTRVYILDKALNPVPIGVKGEIYLSGLQLARGYWNAPEKTEERFIPNPFSPEFCPYLYKTGDLGRWLPDGNIEFHGRVDYQVKIRGNRIEIGEIEVRLSEYEAVKDVAVIDKDDEDGNKYLACYYVSEKEISVTKLRAHIKEKLPDYMVPSRFMRMDHLPLTPNGKVDRKALPELDTLRPKIEVAYVAPRDELEEILAKVWQEILGLKQVGIYDNFFELGGDSIISLQVVGKIKKHGYEVSPRDIYEHQTIAELTAVVEKYTAVAAEQGPVEGDAPLTPIHKWFFDLDFSNKNHFNQAMLIKSTETIDETALRKSLSAVVAHHDILRAGFSEKKQEFHPIGREARFVVKEVTDDVMLEKEIISLQSSFNISEGPVFGVGLFTLKNVSYLLLAAHHLVVDGVSWRILIEDLLTGYGAAAFNQDIHLPEKSTSFKTWSEKLDTHSKTEQVGAEIAFWKDYLADMDMSMPVDHDLGANTYDAADTVVLSLDPSDTDSLLRDAQKAYNTEVNDLLITALMRAISDWKEKEDVVFDLESHGREAVLDDVDISRTVGWFTTLYPVVLRADSNANLATQVKYVKERLRSIPFKGFHYGVLKYNGLFDGPVNTGISFNYLGQVTQSETTGPFDLAETNVAGSVDMKNSRPNFIDIVCAVVKGCLDITIVYSTHKHKKETMENLATTLRDELSNVIAHCLDPENFDITPSDFALANLSQDDLDSIYE